MVFSSLGRFASGGESSLLFVHFSLILLCGEVGIDRLLFERISDRGVKLDKFVGRSSWKWPEVSRSTILLVWAELSSVAKSF